MIENSSCEGDLARWIRDRFLEERKRSSDPLDWTEPILAEVAEIADTPEEWAAAVLALASLLLDAGIPDHFLYEEARQILRMTLGPDGRTRIVIKGERSGRQRRQYEDLWVRLAR